MMSFAMKKIGDDRFRVTFEDEEWSDKEMSEIDARAQIKRLRRRYPNAECARLVLHSSSDRSSYAVINTRTGFTRVFDHANSKRAARDLYLRETGRTRLPRGTKITRVTKFAEFRINESATQDEGERTMSKKTKKNVATVSDETKTHLEKIRKIERHTKDEMIQIAEKEGVVVRKSWTNRRIANAINAHREDVARERAEKTKTDKKTSKKTNAKGDGKAKKGKTSKKTTSKKSNGSNATVAGTKKAPRGSRARILREGITSGLSNEQIIAKANRVLGNGHTIDDNTVNQYRKIVAA